MNKLTPGSNLRWESSRMILPEHREQWLKHQENKKKTAKPILDEQQWMEFEFVLSEAIAFNQMVKFTYWQDGEFINLIGRCHFINKEQGQIHVVCAQSDIHYLKLETVVHVGLI